MALSILRKNEDELIHQKFQVPKMEGFLNLIAGCFAGGVSLQKPYPYSLY